MSSWKKFQGTATAIITPFTKDGSLDESALRKFVEFQIKGGVDALVPLGTTGENPTVTREEHERILEIVIEQTKGRVKIFAGAGSNNTTEAIEKSRLAKKLGVDAVLVVGPYYNKPTQEGYFRHFAAIADAVDIPIIVYNVPGRTGGNIEPATIFRMAEEIPNVVMLKEACGNMMQIMEIARNKPKDFSLLSGDDAYALPLIAVGGDGCISVVANEVPKEFSKLIRYALDGKWEKARELHNKLLPLMNVNFVESNPIPVKTALAIMGLIEESFRLPLCPISNKNREKVQQVLQSLKLI
ncbi:MAG: 4-hydroxy-tetrahydrodipicolinate synthase [Bacteroidetes bacterium]|nr:4-hydroxy-tetrahydrodipicolinate synthase [Bacteroidota bacterium]